MERPDRLRQGDQPDVVLESGLGVLCCEAQADGVPCGELGVRCDDCVRAGPRRRTRPPPLGDHFEWPESFYA
jgi:hypothetical protein